MPCRNGKFNVPLQLRLGLTGIDAQVRKVFNRECQGEANTFWIAIHDEIQPPLGELLTDGISYTGEHVMERVAEMFVKYPQISTGQRNRKAARTANEKGLAALKSNDLDIATQWFEEGVRADSEDVELLNNLGYVYLLQDKLEAGEKLRDALTLAPNRVDAWINWGQYFAFQNRTKLATACFTIGLRLSSHLTKTITFLQQLDKDLSEDSSTLRNAIKDALGQEWIEPTVNALKAMNEEQEYTKIFAESELIISPSPLESRQFPLPSGEKVVDFDVSPLGPDTYMLVRNATGQTVLRIWPIAGEPAPADWPLPTNFTAKSIVMHPRGEAFFLSGTQGKESVILRVDKEAGHWRSQPIYYTPQKLRRLLVGPRPFYLYTKNGSTRTVKYRLFFGQLNPDGNYGIRSISEHGHAEYQVIGSKSGWVSISNTKFA